MAHLEAVTVEDERESAPFRMPVQWVNRPNLDFRGFSGAIVGGRVRVGDPVRIVPAGTTSTVARIVTSDGDLTEAVAGQSVTITLNDEVDCSRGDVLCAAESPLAAADSFEAHVVWMSSRRCCRVGRTCSRSARPPRA
jgi:bifunctional enzyme CysN/CysC